MKLIKRAIVAGNLVTTDRDVIDALFLHKHAGWKPEDLGYPPGDHILIDLMRHFE